jgi:hypothetical protein
MPPPPLGSRPGLGGEGAPAEPGSVTPHCTTLSCSVRTQNVFSGTSPRAASTAARRSRGTLTAIRTVSARATSILPNHQRPTSHHHACRRPTTRRPLNVARRAASDPTRAGNIGSEQHSPGPRAPSRRRSAPRSRGRLHGHHRDAALGIRGRLSLRDDRDNGDGGAGDSQRDEHATHEELLLTRAAGQPRRSSPDIGRDRPNLEPRAGPTPQPAAATPPRPDHAPGHDESRNAAARQTAPTPRDGRAPTAPRPAQQEPEPPTPPHRPQPPRGP